MRKLLDISIKNKFSWKKICKGIEDEKRAFCGPHTVQIDLTDKCNSSCIGCWVHSPLLDRQEIFPDGEKELSHILVKKLIEDLHNSGTKEIFLSGSGEPFMYPKIIDVIKLIKSKGIYLNIITNTILLSEKISRVLVELGVDLITASIWAATPETYITTHPGKNDGDFKKIKTNLEKIAAYKRDYNSLLPHVKIYNVICSKNYQNIAAMVNFAKDVDADSVEFQVVDIIDGKTDDLVLTTSMIKNLMSQIEDLRQRKDIIFYKTPKNIPLEEFKHRELEDLGKIWKDYKEGIEPTNCCETIKCKRGITTGLDKRIMVSGNTSLTDAHSYTFWYRFKNESCFSCSERENCFDNGSISIKLMNILGIGSFIRRILSHEADTGFYEQKNFSPPCYIGWYYTRILSNGDVIPCCKAARHPLGNLHKKSFGKVWNCFAYREFRFKAKNLPKDDQYFKKINCIKSCDNKGMDTEISEKIKDTHDKKSD